MIDTLINHLKLLFSSSNILSYQNRFI
jgi:hypothetical protein